MPKLKFILLTDFFGWKIKKKKKKTKLYSLKENVFSSFEENLLIKETKATARVWKRWDFS